MQQLIIFDFDGVLVDTEYTTFDFHRQELIRFGIQLQEKDFLLKQGRKSMDFFRAAMGDKFDEKIAQQLTQKKRAAFAADIRKYLTPIEGAFALVKQCYEAGLILAIGSQNERPLLERAVDEFEIRQYFKVIRSLQDVTNKKPHPEIFLGIAQQLGIRPEQAVVLEDSLDGMQAAVAGGFKTVAIAPGSNNLDLSLADLVVKGPKELSPSILQNL